MRTIYAIVGAVVGIGVDLAVNLLAAVIQARTPAAEFAGWSVWILTTLILAGALIGWWLGKMLVLYPTQQASDKAETQPSHVRRLTSGPNAGQWYVGDPIRIRRLTALLSYTRLRGQGIELQDVLLIGSRLDIDTGTK